MKTKVKRTLVLALIGGLTWLGWSTKPVQAPLDVWWDSPEERARKVLQGVPNVERFELTNVSLKEAVTQLNRCFENSPAQGSIVFRAWQEGDLVPKEMNRFRFRMLPR